jgi:hypothetical protein
VSDASRPWPLSRLDYRIEGGRVYLDDGRTYPATTLEEELYALLVEAGARIDSDEARAEVAEARRIMRAMLPWIGHAPDTLAREFEEFAGSVAVDLLHPLGRCECAGEGRCAWCVESAEARSPVGWGRPIDGDLEETAEALGVEPGKRGVA